MKRLSLSPVDLLGTAGLALPSHGDGCDLHPVCLTCPFALCQFDLPESAERTYSDPRHGKWIVVALVFLDSIDPAASDEAIAEQFSTSVFDAKVIKHGAAWIRRRLDRDYEADPFTRKRQPPAPSGAGAAAAATTYPGSG